MNSCKIYIFSIIFFFISSISETKIVYDKNNLTITEFEINSFINSFSEIYQIELPYNEALKKFIITDNFILSIKELNPNYIDELDKIILFNNKAITNDRVKLNILRYQQIKNEFLIEFFQNNFTNENLDTILKKLNLDMPYSKNNCITIEGVINYNDYKELSRIFYDKIKGQSNNLTFDLNGMKYEICLNQILLNKIENQIFVFLEEKTKNNFESFVYEKVKKRIKK